VHARFVVIGAGLSGLAAAVRLARFNENVLLLEQHSRVGGLNSYYYRNNRLIETGLHAITNYSERSQRHAPLSRLLRQLKIRREEIGVHQQHGSAIRFPQCSLRFSNEFGLLQEEVGRHFSDQIDGFNRFVDHLDTINPFLATPFSSARHVLSSYITDPLLVDMLLCPMCYYGSSIENDVDFHQYVILFRAIFQEGLFRPRATIKEFLELLTDRFTAFGGTIRLKTGVRRFITRNGRVDALELDNDETITCEHVVSTVGLEETYRLLGNTERREQRGRRLAFTETIFVVHDSVRQQVVDDTSCLFFSTHHPFVFQRPNEAVDFRSGVISLPFNFCGLPGNRDTLEIRTTHLANYDLWREAAADPERYRRLKQSSAEQSRLLAESIIGRFGDRIVFRDSFSPLTIERYTGKQEGAIYGSPVKVKDGLIGYENLVLAGTDQGYLGIIGALLSGVSMVNAHLLMKHQPSPMRGD